MIVLYPAGMGQRWGGQRLVRMVKAEVETAVVETVVVETVAVETAVVETAVFSDRSCW